MRLSTRFSLQLARTYPLIGVVAQKKATKTISPKLTAHTEADPDRQSTTTDIKVAPETARRILISLMFPSMVMPLTSSMSRVALPIIRDHFRLQADMTAWVATAFMLPFMILMPVYGRLSDGLGKRRLILAGIFIFSIGTAIATLAPSLSWLMAGRAIQGVGVGGIMPLLSLIHI